MPVIKQINALLLPIFSKVTYSTCFKKNTKALLQSSQIVILITKKMAVASTKFWYIKWKNKSNNKTAPI